MGLEHGTWVERQRINRTNLQFGSTLPKISKSFLIYIQWWSQIKICIAGTTMFHIDVNPDFICYPFRTIDVERVLYHWCRNSSITLISFFLRHQRTKDICFVIHVTVAHISLMILMPHIYLLSVNPQVHTETTCEQQSHCFHGLGQRTYYIGSTVRHRCRIRNPTPSIFLTSRTKNDVGTPMQVPSLGHTTWFLWDKILIHIMIWIVCRLLELSSKIWMSHMSSVYTDICPILYPLILQILFVFEWAIDPRQVGGARRILVDGLYQM